MSKKIDWRIIAGIIVAAALALTALKAGRKPREVIREIKPVTGAIQTAITATATVQPQNRLEVKPPINGRIDRIVAREGQSVKAGDTLAWMSSTERAALIDAARSYGPEAVRYWDEVYKPTPLLSPIAGEVIVSTDQPGQTVTSSDVVVVLSDHLIVQAQVDETDIGRVAVGQEASISLDAYPQIRVKGRVDHIYYESKIVNNVTIYQVDIVPETVPAVFRSGMTATVGIVEQAKDNVLLIPLEAVTRGKGGDTVLVGRGRGRKPVEKRVELGIADDKNVEVVSGLSADDRVVVVSQKLPQSTAGKAGTNPFMPSRRRQ